LVKKELTSPWKLIVSLAELNLILSRELSVTGEHYLNTRYWVNKLFSIYVDWLRKNALL